MAPDDRDTEQSAEKSSRFSPTPYQLKEECLLSWRREKIINLEIETFVLGKKATTAQQKVDDSVKVNVFKKFSTPQGVVQKATRI